MVVLAAAVQQAEMLQGASVKLNPTVFLRRKELWLSSSFRKGERAKYEQKKEQSADQWEVVFVLEKRKAAKIKRGRSEGPYLSGMKREECVAPIPGRPCLTGLYVRENSPK